VGPGPEELTEDLVDVREHVARDREEGLAPLPYHHDRASQRERGKPPVPAGPGVVAHDSASARSSATRALTSRLTSLDRIGRASGNRTVPFEVSYPASSAAWARRIAAVIGYRLVWCVQAA